jgi:hypothetical protein
LPSRVGSERLAGAELVGFQVDREDAGSLVDKARCDCPPDTARRAGDDDGTAAEVGPAQALAR